MIDYTCDTCKYLIIKKETNITLRREVFEPLSPGEDIVDLVYKGGSLFCPKCRIFMYTPSRNLIRQKKFETGFMCKGAILPPRLSIKDTIEALIIDFKEAHADHNYQKVSIKWVDEMTTCILCTNEQVKDGYYNKQSYQDKQEKKKIIYIDARNEPPINIGDADCMGIFYEQIGNIISENAIDDNIDDFVSVFIKNKEDLILKNKNPIDLGC